MTHRTIVLKFGSSVLRSPADLPAVVHEIYRWHRDRWRVVAVISALNGNTEKLLADSRLLGPQPEPHAAAELLATGERHSAALLGIALDRAGAPARVVDPRDIGFTTSGAPLDAEPVRVDATRVHALLDEQPILIVPGFFGYDERGRLQLLGRGGSDFSAVFLADALGADRCRLVKDVDGVYERDPAAGGIAPARHYATLGYERALQCAQKLIQPKAVHFLERRSGKAEVAALGESYESVVGPLDCTLVESRTREPINVLILGLGTVGSGVYERLTAMHQHFRIVGALVRDRHKHAAKGTPESLLFDTHEALDELRVDVVVDALPGLEPSRALVSQFLARGVHVVSANKVLISEAGPDLQALAELHGATLRFSAAVGGGAPMIEALRREAQHGDILSIAGILNGTCNYVLSRHAEGMDLTEAVRAAQAAGFAEADPQEDLSGLDAARKLRILSREAFGRPPDAIEIEPIDALTLLKHRAARERGETLRHIARAQKLGGRISGQVKLEAVPAGSPLGRTFDEWNKLLLTRGGATAAVTGRGAGKWPTAESVVGDLLELANADRTSEAAYLPSKNEAVAARQNGGTSVA